MIDRGLLQQALDDHLAAHIERQRWSGAPEGGVTRATPAWIEHVSDEPLLAWMVVNATLATTLQAARTPALVPALPDVQ